MPRIRSITRVAVATAASAVLVAGTASPASAIAVGQPLCGATPEPVIFCIKEEPGRPKVPIASVPGVALNSVNVDRVVGYLESYDVRTGPNSKTSIPCVVLVRNSGTFDECANLGLEQTPFYDPVWLVEASVDTYNPQVAELADFYVCTGRITAKVLTFGPDQEVPTLCYEGPLENADALLGIL